MTRARSILLALLVLSVAPFTPAQTSGDADDTRPYGALLLKKAGADARSRSAAATVLSDSRPKIVGGETAEIVDFPWVVGLVYLVQNRPKQYCAGTLIRSQWVLTAAHCALQETDLVVWGTNDISKGLATAARILCFVRAEAFDSTTFDHDVALIRLDRSLPVAPIGRAASSTYEITHGHPIRIVGWGRTDPQDPASLSNLLLKARVDSSDFADCGSIYGATPDMVITSTMFCAHSNGVATCIGDSGGPALRPEEQADGKTTYTLLGIISWGQDCTQKKWPGVYTRVGEIEEFISQHLLPARQCQQRRDT